MGVFWVYPFLLRASSKASDLPAHGAGTLQEHDAELGQQAAQSSTRTIGHCLDEGKQAMRYIGRWWKCWNTARYGVGWMNREELGQSMNGVLKIMRALPFSSRRVQRINTQEELR